MTYGKEPCPCGHPSCKKWFLTGIGSFSQGSGFYEEEVDLILAGLDLTAPTSTAIDPRTGRPVGDHGTGAQAIEFALDYSRCDDAVTFLGSWKDGSLDEWPEFYKWLVAREKMDARTATGFDENHDGIYGNDCGDRSVKRSHRAEGRNYVD